MNQQKQERKSAPRKTVHLMQNPCCSVNTWKQILHLFSVNSAFLASSSPDFCAAQLIFNRVTSVFFYLYFYLFLFQRVVGFHAEEKGEIKPNNKLRRVPFVAKKQAFIN